jgi:hypothetical protein
MIRSRGAIVALLLFGWREAEGGELRLGESAARIDVTSTTQGGWHTDGDTYGDIFERLNIATGTDAWTLAARFDTATFISPRSDRVRDRYQVEKVWVGWAGRSIEAIAGDSYVSLGRGLALSLRKVDELGVDTTLRGGKLLVHEGPFDGTLAAGVANINNLDEATGKSVDDTGDLIGGLEARVSLFDLITVGVQGSAVAFEDGVGLVEGTRYGDRYYQVGPTIAAPRLTENFGFHLEGIAQIRDLELEENLATGFGLYGIATLYFGPATILIEGKAYGDLAPVAPRLGLPEFAAVSYNNPPTVERVIQVIENPQRDIAGARVRYDHGFSPEFLAYVNYGAFRDFTAGGTIHDPYLGVEARWNEGRSWALVSAGWRILDEGGAIATGDAHFEVDASQALSERWSLTLHALHLERKKFAPPLLDQKFREGTLLLGVRFQPWLAASAGYDYTTEPTQPKVHSFNGAIEWYITPSSSLRLFGGAQRGGLKCASGVCRIFPPFEGVKLTATLRF